MTCDCHSTLPGSSRRRAIQVIGVGTLTGLAGCGTLLGESVDLRISGGVGPLPMVEVWASQFEADTGTVIDISGGGTGVGVSDLLNGQVDLAMMGREPEPEEREQGLVAVAMLRDTVVGTIHPDNPVRDAISQQGLSRRDLEAIFTKDVTTWGAVVDADSDADIIVYGRADASAAYKQWGDFLGGPNDAYTESELESLSDGNYDGDQAVAEAVGREPNAIAFNNVNYVWDFETGELSGNVRPVPLDRNDNDVIDEDEDVYDSRDVFLNAVEAGIYPAPPAREMFLAAEEQFTGAAYEFVHWVLHEGQQMVRDNGYVPLEPDRLEAQREKLAAHS